MESLTGEGGAMVAELEAELLARLESTSEEETEAELVMEMGAEPEKNLGTTVMEAEAEPLAGMEPRLQRTEEAD